MLVSIICNDATLVSPAWGSIHSYLVHPSKTTPGAIRQSLIPTVDIDPRSAILEEGQHRLLAINPPSLQTFTKSETMSSQPRPQTRPAAPATQTQTVTTPEESPAPPAPILRLRGAHTSRRRVQWTEDVVDNEKLNRKKSKGMRLYPSSLTISRDRDEILY